MLLPLAVRTAHAAARPSALLLVAACLFGCAQGDQPPAASATVGAASSAGSFDPCALLTKGEVEAVVAWTVVDTRSYPSGDRGHCIFEGEKGNTSLPPEQVEAGVLPCFTNFPCGSDMPKHFSSSAEMVAYRKSLYEGSAYNLDPEITPIEGLGVSALMHELATYYTIEMWLGEHRLAYVSVWGSEAGALALGKELLARAK
jgi:hypothetical protein